MPESTDKFSLPYPLGNDPYDIPKDIERLAKSIDSSLATVSNSVGTIEVNTTAKVEQIQQELEVLDTYLFEAGVPNIEQLMVDIESARTELEAAKEEFSVGQADLGVYLNTLRDEVLPGLEESLQDARDEMDTAMDEFMTRQTQFEDSISTAETEIADAKQRLDVTEATAEAAKTAAATAKDTADQAVQDALAAAGVAEGKANFYSQISAPTGSRRKEGNLWLRTTDNKLHYYDSATDTWVESTDQVATQAATDAAQAVADAADLQSEYELLALSVDGEGGLKDRLGTAENELETKADESALDQLGQKLAGNLAAFEAHYTRVWRQPTPPPAGTTYEWTDGAHVSASVEKVDGVESRLNLFSNPSFEIDAHLGYSGSGQSVRLSSGTNFVTVGGRSLAVDFDGSSPNAISTMTLQEAIPVSPGQWVAFAALTRENTGGGLFVRPVFNRRSADNSHIVYSRPEGFSKLNPAGMSGAARRVHAYQVPDGTYMMRLGYEYSSDGESWEAPLAGATAYTDAWIPGVGSTLNAALAQVSEYFDGDTPDERANDLWYDADGVPHFWLKGWGWAVLEDQRLDNLSQILDDAQDDLQEALEGPIDHERLRVGTGAFDEAFATKLIAENATIINAAMRNLSVSEKLLFAEAIGEEVWAKLGVFDRLEAEEGWIGGTMLEDGVVVTKVLEATEQIITNMFATNYAQIEEELVVKGKLFADNATIINAAMQTLSVSEMANFVTAFADELYADEFTARSATLARAIVAARNLYPDPKFENAGQYGTWTLVDGGIEKNGTNSQSGAYYTAETIAATPGDSFRISANITWVNGTSGRTSLIVRSVRANGTTFNVIATIRIPSAEQGHVEGVYEVPDDPDVIGIQVGFFTESDMMAGGRVRIESPRVENMLDGRLAVPGSIDTSRLDVDEIFGNTAVLNKLFADLITARFLNAGSALIGGALIKNDTITVGKLDALDEILTEMLRVRKIEAGDIEAEAITADKIAGDAITGKTITGGTITGATVRTSASGARTEMTGGGVQVFNSANQVQVQMGHNVPTGLAIRQGSNMIPLAEHAFGSELYTGSNWSQGHGSSGSSMGSANTAGWSTNRTVASNRYQIIMQLAGRPTRRSGASPNYSAQARVALVLRNRATDAIISSTTYALDTNASYFNSVGDVWETSKVWNTFYSVANITAPIGTIFYPQRSVWTIAGWNIAFTDLLVVLRPL